MRAFREFRAREVRGKTKQWVLLMNSMGVEFRQMMMHGFSVPNIEDFDGWNRLDTKDCGKTTSSGSLSDECALRKVAVVAFDSCQPTNCWFKDDFMPAAFHNSGACSLEESFVARGSLERGLHVARALFPGLRLLIRQGYAIGFVGSSLGGTLASVLTLIATQSADPSLRLHGHVVGTGSGPMPIMTRCLSDALDGHFVSSAQRQDPFINLSPRALHPLGESAALLAKVPLYVVGGRVLLLICQNGNHAFFLSKDSARVTKFPGNSGPFSALDHKCSDCKDCLLGTGNFPF